MPKAATTATKKSAAKTTATKATAKTTTKTTKAAPAKKAAAAVKKAAPAKKAAAAPIKKAAAAVKKAAPVKKVAAPVKKVAAPVKKAVATKAAPAKKAAAPVKAAATKAAEPVKKVAEKATEKAAAAKKTAVKKTETTTADSAVKKTETAPKVKASTPAPPAAPAKPAKPVLVIKPMSQAAIAKDPFLSSQRDLLLAEKAEYLEAAASLRAEAEQMAADAEPGDTQFDEESGEGTTAAVDREHNLRLVQNAVATVDEIDRALEKMTKGIYGLCEHCGEEIAKPRLEALPYASLCVACKSGGLTRR